MAALERGLDMDGPLDGRSPKYHVEKADGSPIEPNARYLVVRFDGKPKESAEWHAVQAYILALEADGRCALAHHLRRFFGVEDEPLMRQGGATHV